MAPGNVNLEGSIAYDPWTATGLLLPAGVSLLGSAAVDLWEATIGSVIGVELNPPFDIAISAEWKINNYNAEWKIKNLTCSCANKSLE